MKGKIFIGPMGSGKTRAARLITRNEKVCIINARTLRLNNFKSHFSGVPKGTTVILIDDLPVDRLLVTLEQLSLMGPDIIINPKNAEPFLISAEIIITCEATDLEQMRGHENMRRFDFYFFLENKDHEIIISLQHPHFMDKVYNKTPKP